MSKARSSVDLSAFFNDDDSEGHRFVDFIKKRQGRQRKQKFLFNDCDTERMSFEVQLEKLPTPQLKKVEIISSQIKGNCAAATEKQINEDKNGCVALPTLTAQQLDVTNISPFRAERSNRLAVRKSGGAVSTSDRLRRLSIKNHSVRKFTGGRRTLLQEFESTIESSNFNPPICSTPNSQPLHNTPQLPVNTSSITDSENVEANNANNPISNESCCGHTDTLIKTLQNKDAELKRYMESIVDKTLKKIEDQSKILQKLSTDNTIVNRSNNCSPLNQRTFNIEKGNSPGQLILTPDRCNNQNTRVTSLQQSSNQSRRNLSTCQQSHQNCKSVAQKNVRQDSPSCFLTQSRGSKIIQASYSSKGGQKEADLEKSQNGNFEMRNSPHKNISIIFPTQNVEITEVQKNLKDNTVLVCPAKKQNVTVIPLNQSVSKTSSQEGNNNIGSQVSQNNICSSVVQIQSLQQAEDNLKLTDILTDDEGDTPKSTLENAQANEVLLSLAPSSYNLRKRHQGKRISPKGKLNKDNCQELTSESEMETPPPAHNNKQPRRRKSKPFNTPRGTSLKDKKYAQQLARMSNHEVLDLRKHNSMGQVIVATGRRPSRSLEDISKNKHQMNDRTEQQLLNLDDVTQHSNSQLNQENVEGEKLPVPYNFRDSLTPQDKSENIIKDSSFIGEKSSDRVKFKRNSRKSELSKENVLPEILKHYLDVSKRYSKRQERKCRSNMSKRSLFNTHNLNGSDEHDSLRRMSKELGTSFLKSPPKTQNDFIGTLKVVSPPPAISISGEIHNTLRGDVVDVITPNEIYADTDENITLPPPPPGFENDSNNTNQYTSSVTFEVRDVNDIVKSNLNANNDDHLFKKPVNPVPKRKTKKSGKHLIVPQESEVHNQGLVRSNADLTDCGSLRRSKRGHVPICQPPILTILYQQEIERQQRYKEKKRKDIKKQREEKKIKGLSKTKTLQSANSKKSTRINNSILTIQENDDALSDCGSRDTKLVKKAKSRKIKTRKTHNVTGIQKEHVPSNENIQCSRLILNSPSAVQHLNNIFDQLKQNSLASSATMTETTATTAQINTKPFKVRVRRSKPMERIPSIDCTGVSGISSTSSNSNSRTELVSWLKCMSTTGCTDQETTAEAFKDLRMSSASNLHFTELQGVEYAFYDTEEKAWLGYLRFKPQQLKSKKKAKRYYLHFISLMGLFRITVNNRETFLGVGDMVAIEKLAYYDIQNLTDDIGILMVIKK